MTNGLNWLPAADVQRKARRQPRPIPLQNRYWRGIEDEVQRIFNEVIFIPLGNVFLATGNKLVLNANLTALNHAIANGTVWYEGGRFHGKFNAAISKELKEMGATFDAEAGTWAWNKPLPAELSFAVASANLRYTNLRKAVLLTLDGMNIASIDAISNLPDKYRQTITWMNDDFEKAVRGVTIVPKLTPETLNVLAEEWGQNLNLYISKWVDSEILKLREMVQVEAFNGRRAENIAKVIQEQYGVSQRKAKFLARQETSLLMASFHKDRYLQAGITKFRWQTAEDERVRESHRHFNNKIYFWDQPPSLPDGTKVLPGQDFNCRCIAVPILD